MTSDRCGRGAFANITKDAKYTHTYITKGVMQKKKTQHGITMQMEKEKQKEERFTCQLGIVRFYSFRKKRMCVLAACYRLVPLLLGRCIDRHVLPVSVKQ